MNSRREAKKFLKAYGKALYKSRVEYVGSFNEDKLPLVRRVSYRHLIKRSLVIILVLVMVFSLLVIGVNAVGVKFLNLSFFEKADHTKVAAKEERTDDSRENHHGFYEPGYIPPGFTLAGTDEFEGIEVTYTYVNDNDDYLYIAQSTSDDFIETIDNEDCEIRQDTIEDMEAKIYMYHDIKKILVILKKGDIYMQISGTVTEDEARKIVRGLS